MGTKQILIAALEHDERAIARLCDHFQCIAIAYLKTKALRNSYLLQYLYKNFDDLAIDCIADLFCREEKELSKLNEYFNVRQIPEMKESEVATKIRRLIFSKVNEGLFRNYRNFDPSLSKIIRNLKRTLDQQKVNEASYNTNSGFIEFGVDESALPVMPDEILEAKLAYGLSSLKNTVDAIVHLKSILLEENDYAPKIPLIAFAIMLRKVFAQQWMMEEDEYENFSSAYNEDEIRSFIEKSIRRQNGNLQRTYVKSDKIEKEYFQQYMLTASDILTNEFVCESGKEGYFEHFHQYFPKVDYETYRSNHRQVLEYVVKKLREQLVAEIKKEENFSRLNYR